LGGGNGLEFTYEIESGSQPVSYVTNPDGGASFSSSAGKWDKGVLTLTSTEAKHFTLTLTERPGVEPLLYSGMNDLVFSNKKDPAPGVLGRAFTPGGTDGKPKGVLDTGVRLADLVKTGGTVMLWWRATGEQAEAPILCAGPVPLFKYNPAKVGNGDSGWRHVALTIDEKGSQTFLAGEAVTADHLPLTPEQLDGPITVGSAGDKLYFKGLIDEVRIYDRALLPAEIRAIFEREATQRPFPSP